MTEDHRHRESLAELLQQWLAIDSTSGGEAAFLEVLEAYFVENGWQIERQEITPNRWNLIVTDTQAPRVIYSTHVDTVPPFLPVRREGDRIYGRGACDTKGGLLAMVTAAEALRKSGRRDLGFLLVVGEEVDHIGAKRAGVLDLEPERIILCEPTQNRVVRAQKGMLKFQLCSTGIAGHSAYPDRGESAIDPLLDALQRVREATWPVDHILGPTTINIGVIEGGVAANVFAPSARAELLFRAVSSTEVLLQRVLEVVGDDVSLEMPVYNDPVFFAPPEGVETCTVPFNTDATYLRELGDVWLVGPGDIRIAHSDDEHIDLDDLVDGVALYIKLASLI